jgi:hypothetical protein
MTTKFLNCVNKKSCAVVVLSAILMTVASHEANSTDTNKSNDAFRGASGRLTYQGAVSGGVTFPSADCTFGGKNDLVVFTAPHQDRDHPEVETPGPLIAVTFLDSGATVQFGVNPNPTDQQAFMRMGQKDEVSYAKKGGDWVVTITGLKVPNLDVSNQQWATLSGTLVCTHLINPEFAQ